MFETFVFWVLVMFTTYIAVNIAWFGLVLGLSVIGTFFKAVTGALSD